MLYSFFRPLLFALEPEAAHTLSLAALDRAHKFRLLKQAADLPSCPTQVMGLSFPNPVGLAAGMDKNGEHIDALAALGFGFIEIGTVTPRPQAGNPKPRLFRLRDANAIINRMGFNNQGVHVLVENVKQAKYRGILGINIGKNAATPMARA
ncbi:MAG: quinone-dependent dihydroorotate dehydrogenase, partial [Thiobacillaceae bacterium]